MLKLQFRDRRKEAVWLVDKTFSIGRNSGNSLMIDDPSVADFHAEIVQKNDEVSITSRSHEFPILINGQVIKGPTRLNAGDTIQLGTVELDLIDPKSQASPIAPNLQTANTGWSLFSTASWLPQNSFPISGRMVIGRDPGCDIHIPLDHLSRRHVELEIRSGQLVLKDLESANGTWVNGERVSEIALKTGDKIKLDVLTFEVQGPRHDPHKTIIRSAAPTAAASSATLDKHRQDAIKTPSTTTKNSNSKAPTDTRKLLAEGRQEWLKSDGATPSEPISKRSRTGLMLLILSGVVAIVSTIVVVTRYL